jgi:hypothetical protein
MYPANLRGGQEDVGWPVLREECLDFRLPAQIKLGAPTQE